MATTISNTPLLLSPTELNALLDGASGKSVKLLDATWFMPNVQRDARKEFQQKRIPNAHFWDLDEIASPSEMGLKHMMPDAHQFRKACGASARWTL
jgi:thiosulfate/3-mercaptopyruvate sulfurtransferase